MSSATQNASDVPSSNSAKISTSCVPSVEGTITLKREPPIAPSTPAAASRTGCSVSYFSEATFSPLLTLYENPLRSFAKAIHPQNVTSVVPVSTAGVKMLAWLPPQTTPGLTSS